MITVPQGMPEPWRSTTTGCWLAYPTVDVVPFTAASISCTEWLLIPARLGSRLLALASSPRASSIRCARTSSSAST